MSSTRVLALDQMLIEHISKNHTKVLDGGMYCRFEAEHFVPNTSKTTKYQLGGLMTNSLQSELITGGYNPQFFRKSVYGDLTIITFTDTKQEVQILHCLKETKGFSLKRNPANIAGCYSIGSKNLLTAPILFSLYSK